MSELSHDEYVNACQVYHQRWGKITIAGQPADLTMGEIEDLIVTAWKFDVASWPGPDRAKWNIDHDVVSPSPDGRFASVLYSCSEIRLSWTVGLLALLEGPPAKPTAILQPSSFTCYCGSNSIQWLGDGRYCAVTPYLFNQSANRIELLAFTFLDLANRTFAHDAITNLAFVGQPIIEQKDRWVIRSYAESGQSQEKVVIAKQLEWRPWNSLRGTSSTKPSWWRRFRSIATPWGNAHQQE